MKRSTYEKALCVLVHTAHRCDCADKSKPCQLITDIVDFVVKCQEIEFES